MTQRFDDRRPCASDDLSSGTIAISARRDRAEHPREWESAMPRADAGPLRTMDLRRHVESKLLELECERLMIDVELDDLRRRLAKLVA